MDDIAPTPNLGESLRLRMNDPKTMIALLIGVLGVGIVIGSKLAGGPTFSEYPHRCEECEEQAKSTISDVARASSSMADEQEPTVQPTTLPPVAEVPEVDR